MKRKSCLVLTLCLLFSTFSLCVNAYYHEKELEAHEGSAFAKKELVVCTAEKLDMTAFEGEGPFDFFGISIVEIEDMYAGYEHESFKNRGCYHIKLAPEVDSVQAQKQLSETEGVKEAILNYLAYLDYRDQFYPENSPYIGKTLEELEDEHAFAPDELTVYLNYELDISKFEGEGKHYLYGVCIDTVTQVDSEEDGVYGYYIKFGSQVMENANAIWVLMCNENVVSVDYKSTYGNGDINADGKVDSYDYILAKRMHFETYKPYYEELGYADVNRDSYVNVYDYILLKRVHFGTYTIG